MPLWLRTTAQNIKEKKSMRKVARQVVVRTLVIVMLSALIWPQHTKSNDDTSADKQPSVDLAAAAADIRVIYRVAPQYPDMARQGHIEGPVTLRVIVNTEGLVEKMTPLKGNPFLLIAAMNAIQKWRYRPYLLNGTPVQFQSTVTVKFSL
jgi:TonB family protein